MTTPSDHQRSDPLPPAWRPIARAAQKGNEDAVKALVRDQMGCAAPSPDSRRALAAVWEALPPEVRRRLGALWGRDLCIFVSRRKVEWLDVLMKLGLDPHDNEEGGREHSPFFHACIQSSPLPVRCFLEHGAGVGILYPGPDERHGLWSCADWAARWGFEPILRELLAAGCGWHVGAIRADGKSARMRLSAWLTTDRKITEKERDAVLASLDETALTSVVRAADSIADPSLLAASGRRPRL